VDGRAGPGDLLRVSIELGLVTAEGGGAILIDGERNTATRDPLPRSEKIDAPLIVWVPRGHG
jgi:hypothetical protein